MTWLKRVLAGGSAGNEQLTAVVAALLLVLLAVEGALVRVVATGALDRSREAAIDYACRARESLDGVPRRDELDALALAVVDRNG